MTKLIQVTLAHFNTQPDKVAIGRIHESLSSLQQARQLRIGEAETSLRSRHSQCPSNTAYEAHQRYRTFAQFGNDVTAA